MTNTYIPASSELIRTINHSLVLDAIQQHGPLSRAQIGREVGISMSTSMRVVDELIEEGLAVSAGKGRSTGGRPGELIGFNSTGFAVVSIDLGATKIYGAVTDLSGNILHEVLVPSINQSDPKSSLERLTAVIAELLDKPRLAGQKVMGIGIGVPGVTKSNGVVILAPSLGWSEFPLRELLVKRFPYPIYVENDANLAALGEYGYGEGKGMKNLVVIVFGTGVGAGIIIGGSLYKGRNQSAGEIGYMIPGKEFLGIAYKGFGAFEMLASGSGIETRAKKVLGAQAPVNLSAKEVFEAARTGQDWAKLLVADVVDSAVISIANVISVLDPDAIILSGGLTESEDLLVQPIRERLKNLIPIQPNIISSSLGHRATVLGSTRYVLTAVTGSHAVHQIH
jgi:glucokinase